jgi:hypothetical protein
MKNYALISFAIFICLVAFKIPAIAQSTGNNNTGINKFLGYNGAQNLEFRTNNINRMQLTQDNTATINGFTVNNSGFLGLSANPGFFNTFTPYALLHLNGVNPLGNPQQDGYRAWMRHGIVSTHNQDLMFIGQKANDDDVTDAVIAWADNGVGFFSHKRSS